MGIRLLVQREGGRGEVVEARARAPLLVLPAGMRARVQARSPVTHTLLLSISSPLRASVVRAYEASIASDRLDRYLGDVELMPRTNWVNELCHRYLFERAACAKRDNAATVFLEMEIVKELYFILHERHTVRERSSVVETASDVLQRALALVEKSLFEPDVLQRLATGSGASASTLLRTFRRELGQSPLAYVRARRLDEALLLLKSRRYAVGEVARMVGYQNFAAFSQAFRARFAKKPSEV